MDRVGHGRELTNCAWFTVEKDTGFDIAVEERRFFDHWLKGIDNGVMSEPKVYYYTYNAPKAEAWRSASAWLLSEEQRVPYYLGAKTLGVAAPSEPSAKDERAVDYDVSASNAASRGLEPLLGALLLAYRIGFVLRRPASGRLEPDELSVACESRGRQTTLLRPRIVRHARPRSTVKPNNSNAMHYRGRPLPRASEKDLATMANIWAQFT